MVMGKAHVFHVGSLSNDFHLPVYTTRKVHVGIERNYCVRKKIAPNHVHVIEKGVPFNVGEFKVTPFGVPHDSTDNVGYHIAYGKHKFTFATDVGHITETVSKYMSMANHLIIEANYDEWYQWVEDLNDDLPDPEGPRSTTT